MKSSNNRIAVLIICLILAGVATFLFFILPEITATTIIALVFIYIAIAMFGAAKVYVLNYPRSFPWIVAFPKICFAYLIAQLALSAVFVVYEAVALRPWPILVFLFLHILLLAGLVIWLVLMKGGKEVIEAKDAEVKQKVTTLRLMQADAESVLRRNPEQEKPLRRVIEALKYSDPMSHPSLSFCEEQIQRGISSMNGPDGSGEIPEICDNLLNLIADRNSRVKLLK